MKNTYGFKFRFACMISVSAFSFVFELPRSVAALDSQPVDGFAAALAFSAVVFYVAGIVEMYRKNSGKKYLALGMVLAFFATIALYQSRVFFVSLMLVGVNAAIAFFWLLITQLNHRAQQLTSGQPSTKHGLE